MPRGMGASRSQERAVLGGGRSGVLHNFEWFHCIAFSPVATSEKCTLMYCQCSLCHVVRGYLGSGHVYFVKDVCEAI